MIGQLEADALGQSDAHAPGSKSRAALLLWSNWLGDVVAAAAHGLEHLQDGQAAIGACHFVGRAAGVAREACQLSGFVRAGQGVMEALRRWVRSPWSACG